MMRDAGCGSMRYVCGMQNAKCEMQAIWPRLNGWGALIFNLEPQLCPQGISKMTNEVWKGGGVRSTK